MRRQKRSSPVKKDLAAAVHAVEMLIEFATNIKTEEEFARVVATASKTCEHLEIPISGSETKRKIQARNVRPCH